MEHEQRMDALRRANEVRSGLAQLKRDITDGREDAVALLSSPPDALGPMRVQRYLSLVKGIGPAKSKLICIKAQVSPTMQIGRLGERTRERVAQALQERLEMLAGHREAHEARKLAA